MKLYLPYLYNRHDFWKNKISQVGIWNAEDFLPVSIVIRPPCKSYNALFIRRIRVKNFRKEISDRIFIYNKAEDFNPKYLDSLIVHEMIHQYIIQAGLKDTSTHGRLFRSFMKKINENFKDELKINISDRNPSAKLQGPGSNTHSILFLYMKSGYVYCCVINPQRKDFLEKLINKNKRGWQVKDYSYAVSNDNYFNGFRRCTRALHGIKMLQNDLPEFCSKYRISNIDNSSMGV